MPPSNLLGLTILIAAVLPGAAYTWAYERQASAYGITATDRIFRFIAISLLFHLVLGWGEYALYRHAFEGGGFYAGQFAAAWGAAALAVVIPALVGTVLGGLYATRSDRAGWTWIRSRLTAEREQQLLSAILGPTPAPRAWDNLFSDRPTMYVRLQTVGDGSGLGGEVLAGLFAADSYAGKFPHAADLYLEQAWSVNADGSLDADLGYPLYVAAGQIARIETIQPTGP